jgi:hypothetical protein
VDNSRRLCPSNSILSSQILLSLLHFALTNKLSYKKDLTRYSDGLQAGWPGLDSWPSQRQDRLWDTPSPISNGQLGL